MIVMLHIIIALASIAATSYAYVRPAARNLRISYVLIAMTFASGVYLMWSRPAQIDRTSLSGIIYLVTVSIGTVAARRRVAPLQREQY